MCTLVKVYMYNSFVTEMHLCTISIYFFYLGAQVIIIIKFLYQMCYFNFSGNNHMHGFRVMDLWWWLSFAFQEWSSISKKLN